MRRSKQIITGIHIIYVYKRVRPLTHSLTQHGPGDSMEDWVTNFGVQIGFEVSTLNKTWFCEIDPSLSLQASAKTRFRA